MKKINSILYIAIAMICCGVLVSCKKDGSVNSKELLAFIKADGGDPHQIRLSFNRTAVAVSGDSIVKFAGYLTRESSKDVSLTVASDESLVAAYNSSNKTEFVLLPAANYKIQGDGKLNIKAGASVSADSLILQVTDRVKLTDDKGYILPLVIREVSSDDKGIGASANYRSIYVLISSKFNNVDPSNAGLTGTTLSRTGWVVTASGSYSGNGIARVLDGKNETAWDSDGKLPAWVQLDMTTENTVKGFPIVPSYEYKNDNFITMEVLSSSDGKTWKSQGTYNGTATSSSSTAANPEIKMVRFISPVKARYFKFNITTTTDGSYAGMAELNAVQ